MVNKTSAVDRGSAPPAFDPWVIWLALRKNWVWCMPVGAVLAAGVVAYLWLTFVPEYSAARVLEANPDYVVLRQTQTSRDLSGERQFVFHSTVLDSILSNPELSAAPSLSDPLTADRELRNRLGVHGGGNYLTITYRDRDPAFAAKVCNAVVESYLLKREASAVRRNDDIIDLLTPAIDVWKREVEEKRRQIAQLTKLNIGFDPFKDRSVVESNGAKLMDLRGQVASLEASLRVKEAQLKALNSKDIVPDEPRLDPKAIELRVDANDEVKALRSRISDRLQSQRELERRELHEGPMAGRYARVKTELANARAELSRVEAKVREDAQAALSETGKQQIADERARIIRVIETEKEDIEVRHEALAEEYEREKARIEKMGGETAELFFVKEDYEQASELLKQLNARMAMLKTEHRRNAGVLSLGDARAPMWPIAEMPYKKMLLASLVAMLCPLGVAVLLELWAKRLVDAKSLESSALAPVLGEISRIRPGSHSHRSRRLFDESIDALRANLFFKLEENSVRTIAVTSAMPSEGKSSVSSQLAHSLANATGEMVLLIDADLRSPDLYRLFGVDFGPGLAKVLGKEIELERAINKLEGLVHVLPAGKLKGNPHNLISRKSVEGLFASIPSRYRYVVVDTAPVLPAAETLALTAVADATLLCAMRDVSRRDHIVRAQRLLAGAGTKVLGTVFSGIPSWDYAYRYGDYRYSNSVAN